MIYKILLILLTILLCSTVEAQQKIKVVTTLSTYANIAEFIGGDQVDVMYIVQPDQDAHFVRPKPSYAVQLNEAQLFVSTGLDLEIWAPTLIDMARNEKIRSGQPGYVSASDGIELLDKPAVLSRSEGDLHIYGNPHVTTNPLFFKNFAENITIGLEKNIPEKSEYFRKNLADFNKRVDEAVFGKKLVSLMGGALLTKLANSGQLISFLSSRDYQGEKMIGFLGGWLGEAMSFRDKKIVTYHRNWVYFTRLFGLEVIGNVEPKPGIPPSPKHVEQLINNMRSEKIGVVLAANYFDEEKVRNICQHVNAKPVIVPMYVGGAPGTEDVFKLVEFWVQSLKTAFGNEK